MKDRAFFTQDEPEWLERFSRLAAAFVAASAALVLAGWVLGAQVLVRILPNMVALNPVTAIAFICVGFALWERIPAKGQPRSWKQKVAFILAALVVLVGTLKLLQCLTGWTFHIDRLLFSSRLAATDAHPASEMAPNTALAFLLCGLAVLTMDFELKDQSRPAQVLALIAGLIALLALIGYSYCAFALYRPRGAIPMALITAVNFAVFGLGFLAARPRSGIMRIITSPTNGGAVARRFVPMAIFVPWILGAVLLAAEQKAYFRSESAISIFAVATIFIFTALVWWHAKLLHKSDLDRQLIERERAEENLHQATANLERSNTELQQFACIASHDLNEPLRMITSYLQLLEERSKDKLDSQAREFIGFALDGAHRMQALITDLLAYSRVEAKGTAFEEIDCEQVFETALQNLRVAIDENKATVEHQRLPKVRGDRVQLTQVFQNLVGNALKFHGAAAPRIHVGANRHNGEWIFSVRDNGIGINPKDFQRIFVIFQRLHARQEYSGTGMGLAICKRIVERHGGRIWVESGPQKGSTFFFTLPVLSGG